MTKDSGPAATTMQDRSKQSAPDTTETERTINALLREDLQWINDQQWPYDRERVAKKMEERLNRNLHMAEVDGMRVQIQLQPARARLVKVEL